jgi:hypothetical protein
LVLAFDCADAVLLWKKQAGTTETITKSTAGDSECAPLFA